MANTQNWKQGLTKAVFASHSPGDTDVFQWVWFERGWTHLEALFVPFYSSTHPSPPGKQRLLRWGPASTPALYSLCCLALLSPCGLSTRTQGFWFLTPSPRLVGWGCWGATTPAHLSCPQATGMHLRSLPQVSCGWCWLKKRVDSDPGTRSCSCFLLLQQQQSSSTLTGNQSETGEGTTPSPGSTRTPSAAISWKYFLLHHMQLWYSIILGWVFLCWRMNRTYMEPQTTWLFHLNRASFP